MSNDDSLLPPILPVTERDIPGVDHPDDLAHLTHAQVAEIDRNARAYGWEIGRGQPLGVRIDMTEGNPFMDERWRAAL